MLPHPTFSSNQAGVDQESLVASAFHRFSENTASIVFGGDRNPIQSFIVPCKGTEQAMAPPSAGSTMTTRSSARKQANGGVKDVGEKMQPQTEQDEFVPRDETEAKHRDFFWTYTEEPHRTRRLAIIKAHPEVIGPSIGSRQSCRWRTLSLSSTPKNTSRDLPSC